MLVLYLPWGAKASDAPLPCGHGGSGFRWANDLLGSERSEQTN